MNEEIFRKQSVDKLSSPEQLNDYIKVTSPSVWIFLSAIIVLLVGVCVWGFFGKLDTTIDVVALSEDGKIVCYVSEDNISSIKEGLDVYIGNETFKVSSLSKEPIALNENVLSEYGLHLGNLSDGQWAYVIGVDGKIDEGTYKAQIVTNSVAPFYFVFN